MTMIPDFKKCKYTCTERQEVISSYEDLHPVSFIHDLNISKHVSENSWDWRILTREFYSLIFPCCLLLAITFAQAFPDNSVYNCNTFPTS